MASVTLRPATQSDATAIGAFVEALPAFCRSQNYWVAGADLKVAAVYGGEVVGFAARTVHGSHPQRDLATVFVVPLPEASEVTDRLYAAIMGERPLKMRFLETDSNAIAEAKAHGFVERVTSATYLVAPPDLAGPSDAVEVDDLSDEVLDAFDALYRNTHLWDPPQQFSHQFIREEMLADACNIVVLRDRNAQIVGVAAAHAPFANTASAEIALAGATDPGRSDANSITRHVVAALATIHVSNKHPLWFEVDTGNGTNRPLSALIQSTGAQRQDAILILTND